MTKKSKRWRRVKAHAAKQEKRRRRLERVADEAWQREFLQRLEEFRETNRAESWYRPYLDGTRWATSYAVTTRLINERRLGLGVELGVAYGWNADQILLRCPTASVIGVDAWINDGSIQDGTLKQAKAGMLRLLGPHGDRFRFIQATTRDAVARVPDDLDWAYVDAGHTEPSVSEDLEIWYRKLRPGGLFMGHDYGNPNWPGVRSAVNHFLRKEGLVLRGVEDLVWWVDVP